MITTLRNARPSSLLALAVAWVALVVVGLPAEARVHHHHAAATAASPTTHHHHRRGRHAAAAPGATGRHHHRHVRGAAAAAAHGTRGGHGAHGRHHGGGRGRAALPTTHKRHAALCQSVMVHHHWVQRCRG